MGWGEGGVKAGKRYVASNSQVELIKSSKINFIIRQGEDNLNNYFDFHVLYRSVPVPSGSGAVQIWFCPVPVPSRSGSVQFH